MTPSRKSDDIKKLIEKRTPSKRKMVHQSNNSEMSGSDSEDYENDENRMNVDHANAVLHGESDVAGAVIYGFHTPKKKDAMLKLAQNTPKTPVTELKSLKLDPTTPKTPKTSMSRIAALSMNKNQSTPIETRAKNKVVLEKQFRKKDQESETESSADENSVYEQSSESSDEESNDSESDSGNELKTNKEIRKVPPIKISTKSGKITSMQPPSRMSTRSRAKNHEDFIPDSDNYFMTASNKKVNLYIIWISFLNRIFKKNINIFSSNIPDSEQNIGSYIGSIEIFASTA